MTSKKREQLRAKKKRKLHIKIQFFLKENAFFDIICEFVRAAYKMKSTSLIRQSTNVTKCLFCSRKNRNLEPKIWILKQKRNTLPLWNITLCVCIFLWCVRVAELFLFFISMKIFAIFWIYDLVIMFVMFSLVLFLSEKQLVALNFKCKKKNVFSLPCILVISYYKWNKIIGDGFHYFFFFLEKTLL